MAEPTREEPPPSPQPHSPLIGMYLTYVLPPDENPTFPAQQWHGRVKKVLWTYSNMSNVPQRVRGFLVDILDEGWTEYEDVVRPSHILEISPLPPDNPRLHP